MEFRKVKYFWDFGEFLKIIWEKQKLNLFRASFSKNVGLSRLRNCKIFRNFRNNYLGKTKFKKSQILKRLCFSQILFPLFAEFSTFQFCIENIWAFKPLAPTICKISISTRGFNAKHDISSTQKKIINFKISKSWSNFTFKI